MTPRTSAALLAALLFGAACSASPSPSASATPAATSVAPTVSASAPSMSPTVPPSAGPSPYPAAALPVHGKLVEDGAFLLLAPAPDGTVYVLVPNRKAAVLVRLDRAGAAVPGWPVTLPHTTHCDFLAAAADGSVRAICDATDIAQPDLCCNTDRAYALDPRGRPLGGWPVEIDTSVAARVVGDDLVVLSDLPVTDTYAVGSVSSRARLSRIGPDGRITAGVEVPMVYRGGYEVWAVGPDGVAYAISKVDQEASTADEVLAVDARGKVGGWPVELPAFGSPLAFDAEGNVVSLVGSMPGGPDDAGGVAPRVLAIDPGNPGAAPASGKLPIELAFDVDCGDSPLDRAPMTRGGVTVIRDGLSFHALGADLRRLPGWPYEGPTYLQEWTYPSRPGDDGLDCAAYAGPTLGPDGTLFVPLDSQSGSSGGSLVAIGHGGKAVAGWPVSLRREGSGFWSVEVGPDGTVFAAAVEHESRGLSSTILGIAPDSAVLWRTTVLEP